MRCQRTFLWESFFYISSTSGYQRPNYFQNIDATNSKWVLRTVSYVLVCLWTFGFVSARINQALTCNLNAENEAATFALTSHKHTNKHTYRTYNTVTYTYKETQMQLRTTFCSLWLFFTIITAEGRLVFGPTAIGSWIYCSYFYCLLLILLLLLLLPLQ